MLVMERMLIQDFAQVNYNHNVLTGAATTYAAEYPHKDQSTTIFLDFHVEQMKRSIVPDQKLDSSAYKTTFWDPYNNW